MLTHHRGVTPRPCTSTALLALMLSLAPRLEAQSSVPMRDTLASTSACPAAPVTSDTASRRDTMSRRDTTARRDTSAAVSRAPSPPASENATVIIRASASAREVRFAAQPRIQVRLCGAINDSVHVVERRNLPERVQPGVTYRDVYIAVEIMGHLNAECLSARITGQTVPDSVSRSCASLGIRDSSSAGRARRPPS